MRTFSFRSTWLILIQFNICSRNSPNIYCGISKEHFWCTTHWTLAFSQVAFLLRHILRNRYILLCIVYFHFTKAKLEQCIRHTACSLTSPSFIMATPKKTHMASMKGAFMHPRRFVLYILGSKWLQPVKYTIIIIFVPCHVWLCVCTSSQVDTVGDRFGFIRCVALSIQI